MVHNPRFPYGLLLTSAVCAFFVGRLSNSGDRDCELCPDPVHTRLLEANENWMKGLEVRRNLETKKPIDKTDPWSFRTEVSFYDFFYPTFDCPHTTERIGSAGDGGKWVCGFRHIAKYSEKEKCVVYSYGISTETSFEEEVLQRTKCSVYMFDHTIDVSQVDLPRKYPGRAFIEKIGLAATDSAELKSLKTQMSKNGHSFIDILKVDVEGVEFNVLNSFESVFPSVLPFGQLAVELHLLDGANPNFYEIYKNWMDTMERMGLRAFRNELNLLALKRTPSHNPTYCEYSFINIKGQSPLLHS